jgi:L-arabinokinase
VARYAIVEGSTRGFPDAERFIGSLERPSEHPSPEARELFHAAGDLVVARAPGRLDVMGGIADYSGSLVLELPLREATRVAVQKDSKRQIRIVSLGAEANRRAPAFEMSLSDFERDGRPVDYKSARAFFARDPLTHWAAYVAGAFLVLMRERGAVFSSGARILVASDVPEGKGVSSSAALEVAALQAIAAAFDVALPPRDLALLAQKVENEIVGAPCGVMDQMTAVFGQEGKLLALLCQPAELQEPVSLPDDVSLWGIDSGIRHAVSGSDYTSVRVGAFMGYRMIAEAAGLAVSAAGLGETVRIEDPLWRGYLANLSPSVFHGSFRAGLPELMRGDEFLRRFGGTTDPVTRVAPEREYAVRQPTAHPIEENFRVRAFAELLACAPGPGRGERLGELMYLSHGSYSLCGLGSSGTDRLVALARAESGSIWGAKITGGGSGGTVAVLGGADAAPVVESIAHRYAEESGHPVSVFSGSSPGAAAFGYIRLRPA